MSLSCVGCGYTFTPRAIAEAGRSEVALSVTSVAAEPGVALGVRRGLEQAGTRKGLSFVDREDVVMLLDVVQLSVEVQDVEDAPTSVARTEIDGRDAVGATGYEVRVTLKASLLDAGAVEVKEHVVYGVASMPDAGLGLATELERERAIERATVEACERLVTWLTAALLRGS